MKIRWRSRCTADRRQKMNTTGTVQQRRFSSASRLSALSLLSMHLSMLFDFVFAIFVASASASTTHLLFIAASESVVDDRNGCTICDSVQVHPRLRKISEDAIAKAAVLHTLEARAQSMQFLRMHKASIQRNAVPVVDTVRRLGSTLKLQ